MKAYVSATDTSIYDSCYRIVIVHKDTMTGNETMIVNQVLYDANIISIYRHLLSGNAFNMAIAQWYGRNPNMINFYAHQQIAFERDLQQQHHETTAVQN